MKSYQDINKETIDRWVEESWEWGKLTSHDEYINAKNGEWKGDYSFDEFKIILHGDYLRE
ncbi:methyltransferase [Streptococcus milleri]|uniref:Methyltransferase n=1 Tax=Streptococcus milleri TaxID=33040 RepID=A0A380L2C0_9STRE|nr:MULTISPECIES: hypothetical protein [Streptococcus]SUN79079.1 methyltransferase [Streptococcus milleri]